MLHFLECRRLALASDPYPRIGRHFNLRWNVRKRPLHPTLKPASRR